MLNRALFNKYSSNKLYYKKEIDKYVSSNGNTNWKINF